MINFYEIGYRDDAVSYFVFKIELAKIDCIKYNYKQ